jgi:ribosomal protein S19
MKDKEDRRQKGVQEDQEYAKQWEQQRLNTVAKEDTKANSRQKAILENRRDLKDQMDQQSLAQKVAAAKEQKEKEIFVTKHPRTYLSPFFVYIIFVISSCLPF